MYGFKIVFWFNIEMYCPILFTSAQKIAKFLKLTENCALRKENFI